MSSRLSDDRFRTGEVDLLLCFFEIRELFVGQEVRLWVPGVLEGDGELLQEEEPVLSAAGSAPCSPPSLLWERLAMEGLR